MDSYRVLFHDHLFGFQAHCKPLSINVFHCIHFSIPLLFLRLHTTSDPPQHRTIPCSPPVATVPLDAAFEHLQRLYAIHDVIHQEELELTGLIYSTQSSFTIHVDIRSIDQLTMGNCAVLANCFFLIADLDRMNGAISMGTATG